MQQFVWVVMKNSDWTEGRGPMVLKGVFPTEAAADEYVNTSTNGQGIYGFKPRDGKTLAETCKERTGPHKSLKGNTYYSRADGGWGGFDIIKVDLADPTNLKEW